MAIRERLTLSHHPAYLGMMCFVISEAFLFLALFWTYFYLRSINIGIGHWPPADVHLDLPLTTINTLLLLASSVILQRTIKVDAYARAATLSRGLAATVLLGTSFLFIKGWEWAHASFGPASHAYGAIYFTLTGFHGAHVLGGLLLLTALLWRTLQGKLKEQHSVALLAAGLYWHFVDIVWILVYLSVFIVR
jgi:cytochrome c oxidase subunit 3